MTSASRRPGKRRDLSRGKLIGSALALIDRDGADGFSMRALADAVGVTPMALYNHFDSKQELLAAVADHVIAAAAFDGGHADWRDQLSHCFHALRELCLRHPGLPGLLEKEGAAPASVSAPMEVALRALRRAGLDNVDSLRSYFLLIAFTLGQAGYQTRGPFAGLEPQRRVSAAPFDLKDPWDFDESFAFGITVILNGIEATVAGRSTGAAGG